MGVPYVKNLNLLMIKYFNLRLSSNMEFNVNVCQRIKHAETGT
jgi:hypothetical protein